ncbi:MAG: hypothetical protein WCT24_00420 [Patescibacteria group bacterium]
MKHEDSFLNRMKKIARLFVIVFVFAFAFGVTAPKLLNANAAASPSNIIGYQGRLLNANGVPLTDATVDVIFRLYTASSGGSCLWSNSSATCASATARSVTLTDGLFSENLGDTGSSYAAIASTVFGDNAAVYLDVNVEGESLSPRRLLVAAPYALNAQTLDGIDSTAFALLTSTDLDDAYNNFTTNAAVINIDDNNNDTNAGLTFLSANDTIVGGTMLQITNNDTTNNPTTLAITNTSTGSGLAVTQSGAGVGVAITQNGASTGLTLSQTTDSIAFGLTSSSTTANVFDISSGTTSGKIFDITTSALTTGKIFDLTTSALTTGTILDIGITSENVSTADIIRASHTKIIDTTQAISGNMIDFERVLMSDTGGDVTISGDMVSLVSAGSASGGTLTDSSNVLFAKQDYASATGAVINIDNDGVGEGIWIEQDGDGRGMFINQDGAGIGLEIDAEATAYSGLYVNSAATGANAIDFIGSTNTGKLLNLTANSLTTGVGIDLATTSTLLTSGDLIQADHSATYTTTKTLDGNLLDLSRNLTTNGAGALTLSGALATLSNTGTQTAGTLTDSSNILFLDQNYAASTGAALLIDSESLTGPSIQVDSVATTGSTVVVNAPSTTTGTILSITGGNFTDDSGLALAIDVTESTETANILNIQTDYSSGNNNVFRIEADGEAFSDIGFTAGAFSTNYYDGSITSTGAFTYEAATSFTWQDDAVGPNTLMTLTDLGTNATLSVTGDLFIDKNDNDVALEIDSESTTTNVFALNADPNLSGNVLDMSADGLTSGNGLDIQSTSTALTSGDLIQADHTATYGSGTVSGNLLDLTRAIAGTATVNGSLATLASTNSGSVTDSANILFLDQNYAASTGAALLIDSESLTGPSIQVDSVATTENTVVVNAPSTTTGTILSITGGNFTDDSGLALAIDVGESTETANILNIQTDYSSGNNNVFRIEADGEAFSDIGFTAGSFSTNYYDGSITSTGAFTYESATSFTWQDDAVVPNTLMTLTDLGANATLNVTGDLFIDKNDNDVALEIDSESTTTNVFVLNADPNLSGNVFDMSADGLTSGNGLDIQSTSTALTSADLIQADHTATYGSGTVSGNLLDLTRAIAGTATVNGALATLWSKNTGSVTDSANILFLDQDFATSTGSALKIDTTTSAGKAIEVLADNFGGSGSAISVSLDNLNDGTGFLLDSTSANISSGKLANLSHAGTYTTGGPVSGNILAVSRAVQVDNGPYITDVTGSVFALSSNNGTLGGTMNDSAQVLSISQLYTGATGDVLNINNDSTASTSIGILADSTTGTVFSATANALTTGNGIDLTTASTVLTSSDLIQVDHTATYGSGTISGNILDLSRAIAGTATVNGALATLASTNSGSVTDGANILFLDQNYTASTGAALLIDSESTAGSSIAILSSATTGDTLEVNASATTSGNILDIGANAVANGKVIDIDNSALTTGSIIDIITDSGAISSGDLIQMNHNGSYSTNVGLSGSFMDFTRDLTSTANTLTVTGPMVEFHSDGTVSGGAVTDSSNILFLNQDYEASTGASLAIDSESLTGPSIQIDSATTTGNTLVFNGDYVTTGAVEVLSADRLTSGNILDLSSTSTVLEGSDFIQGDHTATYVTSKTITGNLLDLSRNLTLNDAGSGYTLGITGALATLANTGTQTSGTLSDSSNILFLDQNYAASTGAVLAIDSEATSSNALLIDAANTDTAVIAANGDSLTTGNLQTMSADALTTGNGIDISTTSTALTSSDLFQADHTATYTTTTNVTGNLLDLRRILTINDGGSDDQTLTSSGALAYIQSATTDTSGALAITAPLLWLDEDSTASTNTILKIDSASTSTTAIGITADAQTTGNGILMSVDGMTTGSALYIERGDGATQFSDTTEGLAYIAQLDDNSNGHILQVKSNGSGGILGYYNHTGLNSTDPVLKVISNSVADSANEGINGFVAEFINNSADTGLDNRMGIMIQACKDDGATTACNFLEFRDGDGTAMGAVEANGAGGVTLRSGSADYAEYFNGNPALFPEGVIAGIQSDGSVAPAITDESVIGVRSISPIVLGGVSEGESIANKVTVGLFGQIRVNVNNEGGAITAGDYITVSSVPGVGKKATESGKVVGQALESIDGSGLIKVYVAPHWQGINFLASDGSATTVATDFIVDAVGPATESSASASRSLILRGSAWVDGASASTDMVILNDVTDSSDYGLSVSNNDGSEVANLSNNGDLAIAGNLYPSDRGVLQTEKYIYYDGSTGVGGDLMRTNASGWGTGSYDFAEMFPSSDSLAAGELVIFGSSNESVARSSGATYDQMIAGVVSTKPGFLAGENNPGDVPVALAGRVPTYVSGENGSIAPGDPLTSSTKPGYAMKATTAGPIVGYAMEAFDGNTGVVIAFIRPSYYDGATDLADAPAADNSASELEGVSTLNLSQMHDLAGGKLINVGSLSGLAGAWTLSENGNFATSGDIKHVVTSYQNEKIDTYASLSREQTIQLSGTVDMQNGFASVTFEDVDEKFNDVISNIAPYRVLITPEGLSGQLYVSNRDQNGFTIQENGGSSNVKVDWLVIAYEKDKEPEQESLIPEDNIPAEETPIVSDPVSNDAGTTPGLSVPGESPEEIIPSQDPIVDPDVGTTLELSVPNEPTEIVEPIIETPTEPIIDNSLINDVGTTPGLSVPEESTIITE